MMTHKIGSDVSCDIRYIPYIPRFKNWTFSWQDRDFIIIDHLQFPVSLRLAEY